MKLSCVVFRNCNPIKGRSFSMANSIRHKNVPSIKQTSNTTVDTDDVEHHADQVKQWWDRNGPMKGLHAMNLVRVPFIRDGLVNYSEQDRIYQPLVGKKILDIGCGGGILSEALARLGAEVTGIDASKVLVDLAKSHADVDPRISDNKPRYIYTSVEDHANDHKEHYDAVVASEIIEHVNNKELFIKSSVDTLKTGGRIFFTTPNRTRVSQISGIYMAEYVLNILPKGTHQYDKFITPPELTFLLERNKCQTEAIQGLFYNFVTNEWHWTKFQTFLYALQAVKLDIDDSCK